MRGSEIGVLRSGHQCAFRKCTMHKAWRCESHMAFEPLDSHVRDWQDMAAFDPMRAISGQKISWDMDEFYATAQPHMDDLFSMASSLGLPKSCGRALEFGCGAGRFLR